MLSVITLVVLAQSLGAAAYQHHSFRWSHTDIGVTVLDERLQPYVSSGMYLWTSPSELRAVAGDNVVVRVAPLLPPVHYAGQAAQANVAHSGGIIQQCEVRVDEAAFFSLADGARQAIITHELGHCLGIDHSLEPSIMKNPFFYSFSADDRAAVVALYGGVLGQQQPSQPPPAPAPAPVAAPHPPAPPPAPVPPAPAPPSAAPAPNNSQSAPSADSIPPQEPPPVASDDLPTLSEPGQVPAEPSLCTGELSSDIAGKSPDMVAAQCAAGARRDGTADLVAIVAEVLHHLRAVARLLIVLRWP